MPRILLFCAALSAVPYAGAAVSIHVETSKAVHTMRGGAGASWHAIGPAAFTYWPSNRHNRNARGSGWGGNPPLAYEEAWKDLRAHARWLGLDFLRVEIDVRMYEPERGRFDWDNEELQTLYRILDICEELKADVFLTQMWQDVEWNAFPTAGRLQSAPKSIADFAAGAGALLDHLVNQRGYHSIKWFCMTNEPGASWGWWNGADGQPAKLMPALHALREEFDRRKIAVGLSGPDWSGLEQRTEFDFDDPVLAAHDAHNYSDTADVELEQVWAKRAHARGLPFFLTEFGTWAGDNPFTNPLTSSPAAYSNQLTGAEKLIGGLNAGVDGFNRWSYTNRGDLDGQWQLVRTFDRQTWDYLRRVDPEPVPYFTYGILTRFLAKHSKVLETTVDRPGVSCATVRSPRGDLTILVLNHTGAAKETALTLAGLDGDRVVYKYQVTEGSITSAGYRMEALRSFPLARGAAKFSDTLPAQSITVYSTYRLGAEDAGITAE
jgi:hypothetical protein